jgi:hypothetical protein
MNTLCRYINIPVPFFKEQFNKGKYSTARHQHLDRDEISLEYLKWINSLGLILDHAEVFFSIPNTYYPIHQDQHDKIDFPKINFIYGGSNSLMNWYTVKPRMSGTASRTNIATPYIGYTLEEVDLLYAKELKSPSLVQAGVPHNVTVVGSPRWCVSTVYLHPDRRLLSWSDAEKIFQPYMEETLVQTN